MGRRTAHQFERLPCLTGYLRAVWLEIFGPVFPCIFGRDPPRSPGPAPHINFYKRSAPQANAKAVSRHPKNLARLPSGAQTAFRLSVVCSPWLDWIPEGCLAGDFRAGFPGNFGRNRPRDPPRSPGPAPHINFHEKSAPQADGTPGFLIHDFVDRPEIAAKWP